jgi:hypothetical protein
MLNPRQKRYARRVWKQTQLKADQIYWFALALALIAGGVA